MTTFIEECVQLVPVLLSSMDTSNTLPSKTNSFQQGLSHKTFLGKSPHHMQNTQDFVEQVRIITLEIGECITSYDTALFKSVVWNQPYT